MFRFTIIITDVLLHTSMRGSIISLFAVLSYRSHDIRTAKQQITKDRENSWVTIGDGIMWQRVQRVIMAQDR